MAFVALVEHDGVDAGQFLVALQPLQQHTGGDHLDHRARPGLALAAHREADPLPYRFAQQPGHPPRRGPGREPARLGDQHPAGPCRFRIEVGIWHQAGQGKRHQRRLPGPGRRGQDCSPALVQGTPEFGNGAADGEVEPGGIHTASLADRAAPT